MERVLATTRVIDQIDPIPGANAIDVATVGGWKVVVKKNQFNVGDLVVYLEIDSWVPKEVAPFLFKGRKFNDIEGERLRTVKLRGQVSQGLILPLNVLPANYFTDDDVEVNADVTDILGITKYEKALSANLAGVARGNFPSFIRKTDQERIQNLKRDLSRWLDPSLDRRYVWEVTEKLDGCSMTVYWDEGQFGVCSRNLDLVETEGNAFWQTANSLDLRTKLNQYRRDIAIQGELVGPGIQGNKYKLNELTFFVFDMWDIREQQYLSATQREPLVTLFGLKHVPVLSNGFTIEPSCTIDALITLADGDSVLTKGVRREGLVFKSITSDDSFKVISNAWLLKNEE